MGIFCQSLTVNLTGGSKKKVSAGILALFSYPCAIYHLQHPILPIRESEILKILGEHVFGI